ncbi:MAG: 4-hydroxy-tetrahydrodipicolinate reductase [Candidatus Omnitrophota bacterium]|nr:4-hydroxy-tetrahydrodipicolinate reductase [Candidatus Omnitrophota bacterium]
MIRIAMAGAAGRMGQTILGLAAKDRAFKITGALEMAACPSLGQDIGTLLGCDPVGVRLTTSPSVALQSADVLIDFSHPSALNANLKACVKNKTGYVLGTTGLKAAALKSLKTASKKIPIVQAPNMSIGVNILFWLSEVTAGVLTEDYDIEIAETHHRMKKDAPSGTAMKLLEIVAKARKRNPSRDTVYGRRGETGARSRGKIGVLAFRGGDVVGDHTVFYLGDGERLELTHRASSREAFAQGALRAARFVAKRRHGLYDMRQVLGMA